MGKAPKKHGDRRDGRRIREMDAIHLAMPFIIPKKTEAEVYLNETVDVTNALNYIKNQNETNSFNELTLFHLILAGLAKTVSHRPQLNRFIAGQRYYERDEVSFSFVAKKQFSDQGEESMMILRTTGDSTLEEISRKVVGDVREVRAAGGNELDGVISSLTKLPRPLLRFVAFSLNVLEYYDKVPADFAEMVPFYSTIFIANLGSIKCGAPYHHLTNFGTNSIMVTVGEIHKEHRIGRDGTSEIRDVVEMGFTLDERIADGFYFAKSIKLLTDYMNHPSCLESPFEEEVTYEI